LNELISNISFELISSKLSLSKRFS